MKIAIVGSGAIGLFYGARLERGGAEVHFLLRSGLEEAKVRGIRVESSEGNQEIREPKCAATPEEIGVCDGVVVAVKTTSNHHLGDLLAPLTGKETRLLTLQNGLGNEEVLAENFPENPVSGGLCFVCLNRMSPASVKHIGHGALLLGDWGENSRTHEKEPEAAAVFAEFWKAGGVDVSVTPRLFEARWRKLMWNIPFNGLAVVEGGIPVDQILSDSRKAARCRRLMEEVRLLANFLGCAIEEGYVEHQIARTFPMGDYRPSTLLDFLAAKEMEIDSIWEKPLQMAEEAGFCAPELASVTARLREIQAARFA